MTKQEAAQANFSKGYNCCQAVLVAFQEELGMTEEQAARLGSGMGGGVARLRELCGAVSAMALIAGYCRGYSLPDDQANKARTYAQVRGLIEAFGQAHGAILCRELLADIPTVPGPGPGAPLPPVLRPAALPGPGGGRGRQAGGLPGGNRPQPGLAGPLSRGKEALWRIPSPFG